MHLAEDCHRAGEQQPELFERIEVHLRPLDDIPDLIRRGEIVHSLVINAFALMGVMPAPMEGQS